MRCCASVEGRRGVTGSAVSTLREQSALEKSSPVAIASQCNMAFRTSSKRKKAEYQVHKDGMHRIPIISLIIMESTSSRPPLLPVQPNELAQVIAR